MGSAERNVNDLPDDRSEENGVLFWVNKAGFPLDKFTWERMWSHIEKIHPDGTDIRKNIRNRTLKPMPMPQLPVNLPRNMTVPERIEAVQKYMNELQYNHTGTQFFEIRKNRPISGLMDVARDMIRESLPIKCLEAIILGIYLTNGMAGLERFPISFKTSFNGNVHRHVVLGVVYAGKYGAIGMSRREDLMYKPLKFKSLADLVFEFHDSYKRYWHSVKKMKIGLPIPHDSHSFEQIAWKTLHLNISTLTRAEILRELERHTKDIRAQAKSGTMISGSPHRSSLTYPPSPGKERTRISIKSETQEENPTRNEACDGSIAGGSASGLNEYQIRI